MLSYTTSLALYQSMTENEETLNTTFFGRVFNERIRKVISKRKWPFLYATKNIDTVADQQSYDQPFNTKSIDTISVTVDSTKYTPTRVGDQDLWDKLNMVSQSSDIPEYWFPSNGKIGLYPTPSTAGNTITVNYKKRVKDLSVIDYTTGTLTNTNASKVITGVGTTFTAAMIGRWIKLGDGEWYEIDTYTSATVIGLVNNFEGTTAALVDVLVGEISIIPEEYQMLPVYGAAADYYLKEGESTALANFESKFAEGLQQMEADLIFMVEDPVINDGINRDDYITNPNLHITI